MDQCITKPIVLTDMSGCLVERPACNYAVKMGFSYWCTHPDHLKFNGHVTGLMSREELAKRYTQLRHKRQDAFVVGLDDESRKQLFSLFEADDNRHNTVLPLNEANSSPVEHNNGA